MHKHISRDLLGRMGSPQGEGLNLSEPVSGSWRSETGHGLVAVKSSGWRRGVRERNMGGQLHRCKGVCLPLPFCSIFSIQWTGWWPRHWESVSLFKCFSLLETHSPALTGHAVPTPGHLLIQSTREIEHHTLLLKLPYNYSPVRSHLNLYSNYWKYFMATEK